MNKILVIGASGLVGSKFVKEASKNAEVVGVDEKTIDITNKDSIEDYFSKNNLDVVINFAGYTNVDAAEKERGNENGFCYKLNVNGSENLGKVCLKYDKFLIQISTDFVFPGTVDNSGPYSEVVQVPSNLMPSLGWYGWTKGQAETRIQNLGSRCAIVRISYPFCADHYGLKLDFVKNYLKLCDEGKLFPIFTDQIITPLLSDELVMAIDKIIDLREKGIYHVVSSNEATSYEFVDYLLKKARGVTDVIQKGSMEEYLKIEGKTPRPRLGGLKTEITQEKLGIKFKTWQEMIDEFVSNLDIRN